MDNPEKLAQMLQQQQAMKFLKSMQGMQGAGAMSDMDRMQSGMANGMQSAAMGEAQRQPSYDNMLQMPQAAGTPMQSDMPVVSPQGNYAMPMSQPSYSGNMPTNPQMNRRGILQGAINSLGQQTARQGMGAISNQEAQMMQKVNR
jgi:hypothetical protein